MFPGTLSSPNNDACVVVLFKKEAFTEVEKIYLLDVFHWFNTILLLTYDFVS